MGEGVKKRERENNEIKLLPQLIRSRWKSKWSKTVGECSMGFKVRTSSKQIGVPLEKNGNNRGSSLNQPLFIKCGIEIGLIRRDKECELT